MPETKNPIDSKYTEEIDKAWAEFQNNQFDKAEAICNALTIEFPEVLGSYYLLGHIYTEQQKLPLALEKYFSALEKDKEGKAGGHINYWIGRLHSKYSVFDQKSLLYDISKSREHFRKARGYEDYPVDTIYQLQHDFKNDYDRIKLYEDGIKKFPTETALYVLLSDVFKRLNNIDRQIEILNTAIEQGLKSASLYYNIGEFYFSKKQYTKSINFFIEALNSNEYYQNSNYAINYAIANAYFNDNDFINAEKYYRKSFDESISDDTCIFGFSGLIFVYSEEKRIKEIQKLINEIKIDKNTFHPDGMYGGGPFWLDSEIIESIELAHSKRKFYSALKALKFSEKNDVFLGKYWLIRALLSRNIGSHKERYTAIKNSLKYLHAYNYEFIYSELGSLYSDMICDKIEKHQDISETMGLIKVDFKNHSPLFTSYYGDLLEPIIDALYKAKLYKQIVEFHRLFTHEQITKTGVWFEIGYALNELKEPKEAKIAYENHIQSKGDSGASLNNLANIYKDEGDFLKAIELYKRAVKIDPKDEIPKNNLDRTLKQFEDIENEKGQKKILESHFKSALKSLKQENNFVLEKLSKFILNVKKDSSFKDWITPIQKYKFPILMGTDKQKAEALKTQWITKNYIQESKTRDANNVVIYYINPYLEIEITKINNAKIPENWINGFDNLSIGRLEEIGYFDLISRIQKVNKKFKALLERDFNELVFNYVVQNEKATIVLSGSLIELVLTYHCQKKKILHIPYTDSKGRIKIKKLYDCVLNDLILYAEKHLLFGSDFTHLSNLSRIYRNFIHPGRELKDKLDKAKCDLCFISTTEILKKIL